MVIGSEGPTPDSTAGGPPVSRQVAARVARTQVTKRAAVGCGHRLGEESLPREQVSFVALPLLSGPLTASVDVGAGRTLGPGVALQLSELLLEAAMSQAHNTCA